MKIIFAGTPDFAAIALQHLIDAGHEIALVLSQPDRPSGRGMKLTPSPVKSLALTHNIPVITPLTLSVKKAPEEAPLIHKQLKELDADLLVVAAYGLILPQAVLDCARGIGKNGDIRPSISTAVCFHVGVVRPRLLELLKLETRSLVSYS